MVNKKIGSLGKFIVLFGMTAIIQGTSYSYNNEDDDESVMRLLLLQNSADKLREASEFKKELEYQPKKTKLLESNIAELVRDTQEIVDNINKFYNNNMMEKIKKLEENGFSALKDINNDASLAGLSAKDALTIFREMTQKLANALEMQESKGINSLVPDNRIDSLVTDIMKKEGLPLGVSPIEIAPINGRIESSPDKLFNGEVLKKF